MTKFIVMRVITALIIVVFLTATVFSLQRYSNANPVAAAVGTHATPAVVARYDKIYGYDRPLVVQYLSYLSGLLRGNLGTSARTHDSVASDLLTYVPATLELVIAAMLLAIFGAIVLAVHSATGFFGAGAVRFVLVSGASAPVFLLPLLLILLFNGYLGWLPSGGETGSLNAPNGPTHVVILDALLHGEGGVAWDGLQHLILPAICLAVVPAVAIGRVLRSSLLDVMGTDYIRTARTKGLTELSVVFRHGLRNCMNGVLAVTGLQLGLLFAGTAVVEEIFSWPGVGWYTALSISSDDFPAILGVTLLGGLVYIGANAVVDILQAVADPRIIRG